MNRKTGGIVLAGVDDHTGTSFGQNARVDARKALVAVTGNDYVVLLKHRPIVDSELPFDLQLSGHTHGGQMFPFSIPTRLINGVPTGMIKLDHGRQLYVSRGVGTWGPRVRLFVEPEINFHHHRKQQQIATSASVLLHQSVSCKWQCWRGGADTSFSGIMSGYLTHFELA